MITENYYKILIGFERVFKLDFSVDIIEKKGVYFG